MEISRRTALAGAGAVGLAALFAQSFQSAASAATAMSEAEFEELRQRWVDQLTGRTEVDGSDPQFVPALAALDNGVQSALELLAPQDGDGSGTNLDLLTNPDFSDVGADDFPTARTFVDLPFLPEGNEGNIVETFRRIQTIATAWATPGSDYYEDETALEVGLRALRRTNVLTYNPSVPEYGNWWAWESGAARSLADCMALLREHIEPEHFADYEDAIDFYISDPWYQFPEDSPRRDLSTGANRVDLCQAVIIRSIAGADSDRLAHAVTGLSDVWQIVDSGDGIYYDGSFIQHSTVPYTGTYGLVLLRALSRLFALLADSDHDIDDPSQEILLDSVEGSFAPMIYRAQMMDSVRGRAISRENERSIDNGFMAIEAIATLAQSTEPATAQRWRGRCLHWLETNDYRSIYDGASVPQVAVITELESSGASPLPDPLGPALFARMNRLVYRGQDWATSIAMCSERIAWYECGNGENDFGFMTSNGMTYLYLPDDVAHYDDEYWSTSNLMAPAGTTVDTTELPARTEGQWGESTPENEWTGGAALSDVGLAGQHLIGPGGTGLNARKTWLCLPDMIVALGSDIVTGSGNEVKTVIEHRNLGEDHRRLVVDGQEVVAETELSEATWAHVDGVAGYLLLDVPTLRASSTERTGNWARNHTAGSSTDHTRVYATLESIHSQDHTTYAYAILPGLTASRTRARSREPRGVQILANDADVQAVGIRHLQAANFWTAGRGGDISCDQPASVLAEIRPDGGRVSISDPTHEAATVEVFLHGCQLRSLEEPDERVELHPGDDGLRIVVDTAELGGLPVTFALEL